MRLTPRHIGMRVRFTLSCWYFSKMKYENNKTNNGSDAFFDRLVNILEDDFNSDLIDNYFDHIGERNRCLTNSYIGQ